MECQDGDKKDVRRPMNAFLIFCKRHRSMVREKNPDLDNRSVTRILGDLWANLAEEKKSVYTTLAKQYKDAFMKANPDYKWHNPDKIHQPPAKMATRPTNARVIKNEVDINLDGSIVPGKLADPSKMGGLSLLLMAGQQTGKSEGLIRERHNSETLSSPTEDHPGTSKSALLELAEMCTSELEHDSDEFEYQNKMIQKINQKPPDPKQVISPTSVPDYSFQQTYSDSEPIDLSIKSSKQDSPKSDPKQSDRDEKPAIQEKLPTEVKHTLVELMKTPRDIIPVERKYAEDIKPVVKEEKQTTEESRKESSNADQNDNDIVNCGKMVVDHILDKLFTAQSEGQRQDATIPGNQVAPNSSADERTQQIQNQRRMSDGQVDDCQDIENDGGYRHHLDSESQENDESVPVRKSRRRNRGQRYQALINEGIIQPSKERLAARKAAKTLPEEELEEYDDYTVVEEVNEKKPSRKRMISEGEDGEDLKKYKTGDFDLEAHIADLPACSLEQLSKGKKNAARTRHLSESSIKKQSTPLLVTKEESTTCLPPHVKLRTSEQQPPENIIGSRRRKFRKHSITHLIPANSVIGTNISKPADISSDAKILIPEIRARSQSLEVKGHSFEPFRISSSTEVKCDKSNKMDNLSSGLTLDVFKNSSNTSESSTDESENKEVSNMEINSDNSEPLLEKQKSKSDLPTNIFENKKIDQNSVQSESSVEKTGTEVSCDLKKEPDNKDKCIKSSSPLQARYCNETFGIDTEKREPFLSFLDNNQKCESSISNQDLESKKNSNKSDGISKQVDSEIENKDCSEKMDWSDQDKSELLPVTETSVESTISAPAALRMEILATELKSEEPSMQCQGSPSVTAVHS